MSELRSFRKFSDPVLAENLVQLLQQHSIEYELAEIGSSLDSSFGGGVLTKEYEVKVYQTDFEKANSILEKEAEVAVDNVEETHYLFDFTTEELYQILLKPDEWSELDYRLATKILKDRGENVSPNLINSLKAQRLADLAKPEQSQMGWIYAGYFFSLLGGFLGMFMGWHIWNGKKTLPDGRKVYSYIESDRKHGRNIFIIGVIVFPIAFVLRLLQEIK